MTRSDFTAFLWQLLSNRHGYINMIALKQTQWLLNESYVILCVFLPKNHHKRPEKGKKNVINCGHITMEH